MMARRPAAGNERFSPQDVSESLSKVEAQIGCLSNPFNKKLVCLTVSMS